VVRVQFISLVCVCLCTTWFRVQFLKSYGCPTCRPSRGMRLQGDDLKRTEESEHGPDAPCCGCEFHYTIHFFWVSNESVTRGCPSSSLAQPVGVQCVSNVCGRLLPRLRLLAHSLALSFHLKPMAVQFAAAQFAAVLKSNGCPVCRFISLGRRLSSSQIARSLVCACLCITWVSNAPGAPASYHRASCEHHCMLRSSLQILRSHQERRPPVHRRSEQS
jgi:hypothetical protein